MSKLQGLVALRQAPARASRVGIRNVRMSRGAATPHPDAAEARRTGAARPSPPWLRKVGLVALRQPRPAHRGPESGMFECRAAQLHLTPTPLKRGGQRSAPVTTLGGQGGLVALRQPRPAHRGPESGT